MKILLVYPKFPDTYWSYKHALKFISKKAANPPLGLLTVASILPGSWEKKLVDLNVSNLRDAHIVWADYVFISAMSVQLQSAREVIDRCKTLGRKIVAGGPLITAEPEKFEDVDHLILNEAEITLPMFLEDWKSGYVKEIYQSAEYVDIKNSPAPEYSMIKISDYAMLSIQYSRGCPYDCEFCDITALYGHKVRLKSTGQIIGELENLLNIGWKGPVFFVDDNFIGNRTTLKNALLPGIIRWMEQNGSPFYFTTEASINLADDPELMTMMVNAGFTRVFIGIETPEEASLAECNKTQNHTRDMIQSVRTIQSYGLEVLGGFIVGFDNDPPNIFQRQVDFIQNSGIISAMVGLLNAPRKTKLYRRLMDEGRITDDWSGDNTDSSMNFTPRMDKQELVNGYQYINRMIYSSKAYYQRVITFLKHYNPPLPARRQIRLTEIKALLKSILVIGIFRRNRWFYWRLLLWSLFRKPQTFTMAVAYSIYGYHYRKVFKGIR